MSELSLEQIYQTLRSGGRPATDSVRKFCKEASGEQLREVFRRNIDSTLSKYDRHLLAEEIESRKQAKLAYRHEELSSSQKTIIAQLEELKKPHWTLVPTFWLVIVGCVAGIIAALFEVLNREEPVKPSHAVVGESTTLQQAELSNPSQNQTPTQKPNSAKP